MNAALWLNTHGKEELECPINAWTINVAAPEGLNAI